MKKLLAVLILIFALGLVWYIYIKDASKGVVIEPQVVIQNENANDDTKIPTTTDIFQNQPGDVKFVKNANNGTWVFSVDILSRNNAWIPGDSVNGNPFINQKPLIKNLTATNKTKFYTCGKGPDNNDTTPDVLVTMSEFIQGDNGVQTRLTRRAIETPMPENYVSYFFDTNGPTITAIYEQCLP